MKRVRALTPGVRRASIPLSIVMIVVVAIAAACGTATGTPASGSTPEPTASGSPVDSPVAGTPSNSAGSDQPGSSATGMLPSPSSSPIASGPDVAAAACFGSAKTRDFFVAIAEAVPWPVYCAVLPAGWSVETGSYRLADGGRLVISYKTPTGAHLQLQEGHWCTDSVSACTPHDSDIGPANFGDQQGELMTSGGGFALYVAAGQNPSWTATATGLDEATFRQLCAAFGLIHA